eukprot:3550202-Heterocapsa_arctica.AAC.1
MSSLEGPSQGTCKQSRGPQRTLPMNPPNLITQGTNGRLGAPRLREPRFPCHTPLGFSADAG